VTSLSTVVRTPGQIATEDGLYYALFVQMPPRMPNGVYDYRHGVFVEPTAPSYARVFIPPADWRTSLLHPEGPTRYWPANGVVFPVALSQWGTAVGIGSFAAPTGGRPLTDGYFPTPVPCIIGQRIRWASCFELGPGANQFLQPPPPT
jgi:hypothetical protein